MGDIYSKTFCNITIMTTIERNIIKKPLNADVAELLLKVEETRFGSRPMTNEERHQNPVLLHHELKDLGGKSEQLASEEKLVSAGILWIGKGLEPKEESLNTFTKDTNKGLTSLESSIIETQARAIADGRQYSSLLFDWEELERMKRFFKTGKGVDVERFVSKVLSEAEFRDDMIDEQYGKAA